MRSLTTFSEVDGERRVGRLIPRPDIPIQPVLSWGTFFPAGGETAPAVTDQGQVAFVTAARIAIAHALKLAGVQPGERVLVPAYHCIVMIEPIIHIGALPVFYRLREDLSVDLDDVAAKLDRATRAFIAVNYFGFPQDLVGLRRFCDEHHLAFIEDCAHSFFGSHAGQPLGSFGHYAVASLAKFFPVRDGGCLVIGRGGNTAPIALEAQGVTANLAAALDGIEDAVNLKRLTGLGPLLSLAKLGKGLVRSSLPAAAVSHGDNPAQQRSGQQGGFDPIWINRGATAVSRAIYRHAARRRVVAKRRRHYARLTEAFSNLRYCRPVFPRLPQGVVPYMFPLWIDHLAEIFPALEDHAIPMQRFGQFLWPDMDDRLCDVTQQHSRHGVQLACHQELGDQEVTQIIDRVRHAAA